MQNHINICLKSAIGKDFQCVSCVACFQMKRSNTKYITSVAITTNHIIHIHTLRFQNLELPLTF